MSSPGRQAGVFRNMEGAPEARHKISVPVLRTSDLCFTLPRPHGRGYALPALRACLLCVSVVNMFYFGARFITELTQRLRRFLRKATLSNSRRQVNLS